MECKLSNLATAIEFNAFENLLKQYKKHEETLKLINKKIDSGEYVIEIKDTQKKAFLKDVANYIKSSESVDVRLFLHSVIKEILVSNDDVELRLNVA